MIFKIILGVLGVSIIVLTLCCGIYYSLDLNEQKDTLDHQ